MILLKISNVVLGGKGVEDVYSRKKAKNRKETTQAAGVPSKLAGIIESIFHLVGQDFWNCTHHKSQVSMTF